MNEFEWRRQLRDLRQPLTPSRDLWLSIDAAMDDHALTRAPALAPAPQRQTRQRQRWVVAASLAAALLLAGGIGWHLRQPSMATPVAGVSSGPPSWKPADPRLAGAAIELDAARMELQLAIQQAPNSPALQRLLSRTELRQMQLRQLTHQSG